MTARAIAIARALDPGPRPWAPVKATRGTTAGARRCTNAVAHTMVTSSDGDWV